MFIAFVILVVRANLIQIESASRELIILRLLCVFIYTTFVNKFGTSYANSVTINKNYNKLINIQ